jgi:UDP-glucose 4-epimerase
VKVLVTGGAGYIGSVIVKKLIKNGDQVCVIDDLSKGYPENVDPDASLYKFNLLDLSKTMKTIKSYAPDAIIHMAASSIVSESMTDPVFYYNNNVCATINLVQAALEYNINNFIFSSTAAVYGNPEYIPIDESHPENPINVYGESKLTCEKFLKWITLTTSAKCISLRYFNAAGSYEGLIEKHMPETHLIPNIFNSISEGSQMVVFGNDYDTPDGTPIRDYIHVSDLADAHIMSLRLLCEKDSINSPGFMIFNLGCEQGHSVLEVINTVEKVTGKKVNFVFGSRRPGDPPTLIASYKYLKEITGWNPKNSNIADIVKSVWKSLNLNREV